VDERDAR